MTSKQTRDLVFISYHHKDQLWLERLELHLRPLLRRGTLSLWSNLSLDAGDHIQEEAERALQRSCVVVMLISADYLAAPEMDRMLSAAKAYDAKLLWLPVGASGYEQTELKDIVPLLAPALPLGLLSSVEADVKLVEICESIARAVKLTGAHVSLPTSPARQAQGPKKTVIKTSSFHVLNKLIPAATSLVIGAVAIATYYGWESCKNKGPASCDTLPRDESSCEHGAKASCHRIFECQNSLCGSGNLSACFRVCSLYETGKGTDGDLPKALSCYEGLCERGSQEGCLHTAIMLSEGSAGPRNESRAYDIYTKLCQQSDSWACNNLANLYYAGKGIAQDYQKAGALYQKACQLQNPLGCSNVKMVKAFSSSSKEQRTAFEGLDLDCGRDVAAACNSVGVRYARGIDTLIDHNKSREYFEKSCKLDFAYGCLNLGKLLATSASEAKDATAYYRKACHLGSRKGCFSLATALESGSHGPKEEDEALNAYRKACVQDDARSCFRLGQFLESGKGGEPKNIVSAKQAYEKACRGGFELACKSSIEPPKSAAIAAESVSARASGSHDESPAVSQTGSVAKESSDRNQSAQSAGGGYEVDGENAARSGSSAMGCRALLLNYELPSSHSLVSQADILLLSSVYRGNDISCTRKEMFEARQWFHVEDFHTSTGLEKLVSVVQRCRPRIVHFSGHGDPASPLWVDQNNDECILNHLTWNLIVDFLSRSGVQCVFFNTCYSDALAYTLTEKIEHVVAVSGEISHRAAIELSSGFYSALRVTGSFRSALDSARQRSARAQPGVKVQLFQKDSSGFSVGSRLSKSQKTQS